jgi:hypothetical protein
VFVTEFHFREVAPVGQQWVEFVAPAMFDISQLAVVTYKLSGSSVLEVDREYLGGPLMDASIIGDDQTPDGLWRVVLLDLGGSIAVSAGEELGIALVIVCFDGTSVTTDFVCTGEAGASGPGVAQDGLAQGETGLDLRQAEERRHAVGGGAGWFRTGAVTVLARTT